MRLAQVSILAAVMGHFSRKVSKSYQDETPGRIQSDTAHSMEKGTVPTTNEQQQLTCSCVLK